MTSQVTVPSEKIKLLFNLINKAVKKIDRDKVYIYFMPNGLYAVIDIIHLVVPVPLALDIRGFMVRYNEIAELSKSEGDIVFSIRDTEADRNSVEFELQNGEEPVWVTYKERSVMKEIITKSRIDIVMDLDYHKIPDTTVESSEFLPAIATCSPYRDFESAGALNDFCIDDAKIVVTDGHCLFVVNVVDISSRVFEQAACEALRNEQFLLDGRVGSLLPKSGNCRLSSRVVRAWVKDDEGKQVEKDIVVLYVGFSDYYIVVSSTERRFPRWRLLIPENEEGAYKLHIDPRDVQVCLNQLKELPTCEKYKQDKRNRVHLHIVEGRFCIDSCSVEISNTRLQFSEFTTGVVPENIYIDVQYLCGALQLATEVRQTDDSPLCFESATATVVVMPYTMKSSSVDACKEVTHIVDLQDHWKPEQPVKKTVVKKQPQNTNTTFAHTYRDIIETLQKENEQLKKENEQLHQLSNAKKS
jgi:hypothetical protein